MCTPPHSLHRLYRPVLFLSANLCVYHIAYVYSRTPLFGEPPPPQAHTKEMFVCMLTTIQTNTKRLKQNLPRSLHTCLDTSSNGMFHAQRSRDNQPNARMRAQVRMETCLPRTQLFICLVLFHMQPTQYVGRVRGGGEEGRRSKEFRGVCVWHIMWMRLRFVKRKKRGQDILRGRA